ncbi:MAG: hypothetical protein MRY79_01020 [Alphaproteobacteria bacterium]|nr:hypothetical protein [Alphaproteobacteria bacterium]
MKKITTLSLFLVGALVLSACQQTFMGMEEDFRALSTKFEQTIGSKEKTAEDDMSSSSGLTAARALDGSCPPIHIDPQMDHMSEFSNMENPTAENEISRIRIAKTQAECTPDGEYLSMRIDLSFEGSLGPDARRMENDRPFFAYPYFVAVTDTAGNELAKELFAASVTYDGGTEQIELVETIRQKLPLDENGQLPPYQVHIGFQLTEEQLFYNASH